MFTADAINAATMTAEIGSGSQPNQSSLWDDIAKIGTQVFNWGSQVADGYVKYKAAENGQYFVGQTQNSNLQQIPNQQIVGMDSTTLLILAGVAVLFLVVMLMK